VSEALAASQRSRAAARASAGALAASGGFVGRQASKSVKQANLRAELQQPAAARKQAGQAGAANKPSLISSRF